MRPLTVVIFWRLIFSIIPLLHVIVFTMKTIFTIPIPQRAVYQKKKLRLKEREVNFRSPSYGSPWVCGIWPIIGILLIWINECKNYITRVIFCPWVNGITFIFILVTFIRFTAVSAYPVTILCQCTGISQYWLASYETTLLLQALPFLSHFCCSSNAASARVGLSTCFVLEHVYPFKLCYIFAPLKPRIILIRFIFCLPTFLCRFFFSLFPRCHVLI